MFVCVSASQQGEVGPGVLKQGAQEDKGDTARLVRTFRCCKPSALLVFMSVGRTKVAKPLTVEGTADEPVARYILD